jgi:hypothetical protein
MTAHEATELRTATARHRAEVREEQTLRIVYEAGYMACLTGACDHLPLSASGSAQCLVAGLAGSGTGANRTRSRAHHKLGS